MAQDVILLTNIRGLGAEGDRVNVADGYARNFLIPRRLASAPEAASAKRIEQLKKIRAEREAVEKKGAEALAKRLNNVTLTIAMPSAQEGKIFGGITAAQIAEQLKQQGFALDKRQIKLERPIHTPGEHSVIVHPHADINATIQVVVTAEVADKKEKEDRADRSERGGGKRERRSDREKSEPVATAMESKASEASAKPSGADRPKKEKAPKKSEKKSS